MFIRNFYVLCLLLLSIGVIFYYVPSYAEDIEFKAYSVQVEQVEARAKDIDWSSHAEAWNFRTRLREGLGQDVNFAGRYVIVGHGCGTSCQVYWILDPVSGRVIDQLVTSLGLGFRADSRLLIKDVGILETEGEPCFYGTDRAVYYVLENEVLEAVKEVVPDCVDD